MTRNPKTAEAKLSKAIASILTVLSLASALFGAGVWIQSQLSDRPTREETKQVVQEHVRLVIESIDKELDAQQDMLQKIYEKVERQQDERR